MAELGRLGNHQGDEEPALRCHAPPEGRGEPVGAPGGVGYPRGPREGPLGGDSGGVARKGAKVGGFPGGGGGAPHHGCGCQQLGPPGLAQRPHPLALPPADPTAAAAPAPTRATTQVTAAPAGQGDEPEGVGRKQCRRTPPPAWPGPPTRSGTPTPATVPRGGGARTTSGRGEGGGNERGGRPTALQPANR